MLVHNSKVANVTPSWEAVSGKSLPRIAYAEMGKEDEKASWAYPHHWVKEGVLMLHKEGLAKAWAAANAGKGASDPIKKHLRKHREDIGAGATKAIINEPWLIEEGWLEIIYGIANREGDLKALSDKAANYSEDGIEFRGDTAIINIRGPIFRYANLFTQISGATSTELLARNIGEAGSRKDIRRIILDFDSPGGQVTGISELGDMIHALAAKKKVIGYVSGTAASAAYWLLAATGKIVASDTAILGSIGVVATFQKTSSDEFEIVSTKSPDKRIDPSTDKGKDKIRKTLDALAEVFIEKVAAFRGVDKKYVEENFGKGGVLVGKQAIGVKMIDALGTFEQLTQGGQKMEITKEAIAEKNPELLEQLEKEARADLEAENQALKDGNKALHLEVFTKTLAMRVGEDHAATLAGLMNDNSEEAITKVANIITTMQDAINALGKAKGSEVVPKQKSDEPDMSRVRAIAKEQGISLTEALVEYEKGGNE